MFKSKTDSQVWDFNNFLEWERLQKTAYPTVPWGDFQFTLEIVKRKTLDQRLRRRQTFTQGLEDISEMLPLSLLCHIGIKLYG